MKGVHSFLYRCLTLVLAFVLSGGYAIKSEAKNNRKKQKTTMVDKQKKKNKKKGKETEAKKNEVAEVEKPEPVSKNGDFRCLYGPPTVFKSTEKDSIQ